MSTKTRSVGNPVLSCFDRTAVDQVMENLSQALRVLELAPATQSELLPHPLVIVRAEIENARRYLALLDRKGRSRTKAVAHYPVLDVA